MFLTSKEPIHTLTLLADALLQARAYTRTQGYHGGVSALGADAAMALTNVLGLGCAEQDPHRGHLGGVTSLVGAAVH